MRDAAYENERIANLEISFSLGAIIGVIIIIIIVVVVVVMMTEMT